MNFLCVRFRGNYGPQGRGYSLNFDSGLMHSGEGTDRFISKCNVKIMAASFVSLVLNGRPRLRTLHLVLVVNVFSLEEFICIRNVRQSAHLF